MNVGANPLRVLVVDDEPAILRFLRTELAAQGASATTTFAMRLVWEAQSEGEPAAWVTSAKRCFFPPDAVAPGGAAGNPRVEPL